MSQIIVIKQLESKKLLSLTIKIEKEDVDGAADRLVSCN